ncbi:RimJ/RimL family protein N-acetyltransferase [Flavobacterium sp. HSC-32F16]|uniref:GNAT family N-acetyltransferase n=1 Tax=Flavobacterium sp. HSC-32F16 TaxID=2910964 RepID=UPI0020A51A35|nr:GNAT family protein [Flavobacterium sp. HSC-32F16]MCP2029811.1 RimJ/RimL family protein N-acetyltransferase [Flavobacterium sp. HSC-32F16]
MNLKIRPWNKDDLESLVENANNYEVSKFLRDTFPYPYSHENGIDFINFANIDNPIHLFAIEINNKAVGGIGIKPQADIMRKNAELGYWLGQNYWGKGIISQSIKEVVDFGFKTYDIERIYASTYGTNIASQKVLEKNKFKLEAKIEKNIFKNGEYFDELIYAIRRK